MKRVVITGIGVVSPLGTDIPTIAHALSDGQSAVVHAPDYATYGFGSRVHAPVSAELPPLSKDERRFLGAGDTLVYGYHAMKRAVADSGLEATTVAHPLTGCIVGTGGPSTADQTQASDTTRDKGARRVGPFMVVPTMSSGLQAKIATDFGIKGVNFSITSACATSAHAIGEAAWMICTGRQRIMFAGGSEDCHWSKAQGFDGMRALSSKFNDTPSVASRAFDKDRDGFVDGAGGAVVVLEEYDHAKARGATIYAEVVGYGATSDGADMTAPSGEGAYRCMQQALIGFNGSVVGPIAYVNTHGTSTPVGDIAEMRALAEIFSEMPSRLPWVNSTKSLTGHALGAAGALEAVYSIIQMSSGFVAASAHIDELDPEILALGPIAEQITRTVVEFPQQGCILSNSFGFGGTNATLALARV